jgi:hypothetical protein
MEGMTEDELQQEDAEETAGVDEESGPQGLPQLLVEFGVRA